MKIKFFKTVLSLFIAALFISMFYSLSQILELSELGIWMMCGCGVIMSILFALMIFEPQPKVIGVEQLCEKRSVIYYDNGTSMELNKDLDVF